jgi:hypothetical protein
VNKIKTYSIYNSSGVLEDKIETESKSDLNFNYSIRLHLASSRSINPFIAPSIIIMDSYQIYLLSLGVQFRISKDLFFEVEFAKGFWTEHDNQQNGNKSNYFNFGLNRIIKSKFKNKKYSG